MEEEDGDRQEEEVEEKGEVESRRTHHGDGHGRRYESAQDLSHECAMCIINRDCEQCAICADSMHVVRHAIVEVNVVIGVLVVHGELLVVVRVFPVFLDCDAVVHRIRSHSCKTVAIVFIVAILRRILLYWRCSVHTHRR